MENTPITTIAMLPTPPCHRPDCSRKFVINNPPESRAHPPPGWDFPGERRSWSQQPPPPGLVTVRLSHLYARVFINDRNNSFSSDHRSQCTAEIQSCGGINLQWMLASWRWEYSAISPLITEDYNTVREGLVENSSTTTIVVGLIYDNYFCYLWEISPSLILHSYSITRLNS